MNEELEIQILSGQLKELIVASQDIGLLRDSAIDVLNLRKRQRRAWLAYHRSRSAPQSTREAAEADRRAVACLSLRAKMDTTIRQQRAIRDREMAKKNGTRRLKLIAASQFKVIFWVEQRASLTEKYHLHRATAEKLRRCASLLDGPLAVTAEHVKDLNQRVKELWKLSETNCS